MIWNDTTDDVTCSVEDGFGLLYMTLLFYSGALCSLSYRNGVVDGEKGHAINGKPDTTIFEVYASAAR